MVPEGRIVRSIKELEKALQRVSPGVLQRGGKWLSEVGKSRDAWSFGPNDHAKGPHLDSHSARMSFQPWPFQKVKGLLRENIPAVTRL